MFKGDKNKTFKPKKKIQKGSFLTLRFPLFDAFLWNHFNVFVIYYFPRMRGRMPHGLLDFL